MSSRERYKIDSYDGDWDDDFSWDDVKEEKIRSLRPKKIKKNKKKEKEPINKRRRFEEEEDN